MRRIGTAITAIAFLLSGLVFSPANAADSVLIPAGVTEIGDLAVSSPVVAQEVIRPPIVTSQPSSSFRSNVQSSDSQRQVALSTKRGQVPPQPKAVGVIISYQGATGVNIPDGSVEVLGDVREVLADNLAPSIDAVVAQSATELESDLFAVEIENLGSQTALAEIVDVLGKTPGVASVEPDWLISVDPRDVVVHKAPSAKITGTNSVSTNAVQSNPVWGLDRIDQRDLPLDDSYSYDYTAAGVRVYVVDTGVRSTHSELAGRVVSGYTSIDDGLGSEDCNGHGTHVAGTIAGDSYGVAKSATIVPVRVLDCEGSGSDSTIISGLQWVLADALNNPTSDAVVNMSLGGSTSEALDNAVMDLISAGVTVVVASGNESQNACDSSPARVPAAITVNASTIADDDADFSNYGSCSDLYAPGVDILSAWRSGDDASRSISGTSMAAPHVAGVAAQTLEANPGISPCVVAGLIVGNATNIGFYQVDGDPDGLLFGGFLSDPPDEGRTISGTLSYFDSGNVSPVTDEQGLVSLYNCDGVLRDSTYTDTTGFYSFAGVPMGTYYLKAGYLGESVSLVDEWYFDKPALAAATPITVDSSNLTGYDINLAYGASIEGNVTATNSSTVAPGVQVCAFVTESVDVGCTYTDDAGNYVIPNLPNGDYRLFFDADGYLDAWLGDSGPVSSYASAATKTVSPEGLGLTAQNITLLAPLSISGQLKYFQTTTSEPVVMPGASVGILDEQGNWVGFTEAGENGGYTVDSLWPGTYYLYADDWNELHPKDPACADTESEQYGDCVYVAPEFYADKPAWSVATPIFVDSDNLMGYDINLAYGASIEGNVTATNSSTVAPGVQVCAYADQFVELGCTYTDDAGNYDIPNLPNGDYRLFFDATEADLGLGRAWLGDSGPVSSYARAATKTVSPEGLGLTAQNVTLAAPQSISGKAQYFPTTSSTNPVDMPGARVYIYDDQGYWIGSTQANNNGEYTVDSQGPGTYYLSAEDWNGEYPKDPACLDSESDQYGYCVYLAPEFYFDKPDWNVATPITVGSSNVTGRNINLAYGASIEGNVTATNSSTVAPGVQVCAFVTEDVNLACVVTDEAGNYDIPNLPNGDYRLFFDPTEADLGLSRAWLGTSGPVANYASATTKTVSVKGLGLTAQNITLVAPPTISGQVKYFPTTGSANAVNMPGVRVVIHDEQGDSVGFTEADENGEYTIVSQGSGTYYLSALDSNGLHPKVPACSDPESDQYGNCVYVAPEFYSDKPDLSVATAITVGFSNLTGYNINLAYGASIKGKVTRTNSTTVAPGVEVCAFVTETLNLACAYTDDAGNYDIPNLPNGSYRLYFRGEGLKEAWLGASGPVYSYASAATLTVSVKGLGLTGKNVILVVPPSISGLATYTGITGVNEDTGVLTRGTASLPEATVQIYNATTGDLVDSVMTDGGGNYTYIPEGPGSFKLRVDPSSGNYFGKDGYFIGEEYFTVVPLAAEWFTDVPDFSLATALTFTTTNLTSKNINLAPEASISGSVSYLSEGVDIPVGGVDVCAYFSATLEPFACGTSADEGSFLIGGLPNGAYKLKFDTSNSSVPLTTSWLGSSSTTPVATYALATAQTITTAGVSLVNKNLRLPLGTLTTALPTISGTGVVGSTLTGDPGEWGPEGVTLSYAWLRGTTVVGEGSIVMGEDAPEYVVTAFDMGQSLTFKVTGVMEYYTTASRTSAPRAVPVIPSIKGRVTYTGITGVNEDTGAPIRGTGSLLEATVQIYNATTGDLVDSVETDGGGNYIYIPEGPGSFKLRVDPSSGYYLGEEYAESLAPEWFTNVPDISLATAIPFTTTTLTGKDINLAPEASISGSVSYLDGVDIPVGGVEVCAYFSATLDPFACGTSSDEGNYSILGLPNGAYKLKFDTSNASVPLTTSWLGSSSTTPVATYALATAQTITTAGASLVNKNLRLPLGTLTTALPTISGTGVVGSTLTGAPGEWGPEGVTLSGEWLRANTTGGTTTVVGSGFEYEVQVADVGKSLTFKVTGVMEYYTTASRTSAAVTGGYAWTDTPTPTISGTAKFGQTLTANEGTWDPTPTSFTYQWMRDGEPISGAMAKTYALQLADIGNPITVKVSGVKTTFASSLQTSAPTVAVDYGTFITSPNPTITGSAVSGQTLTAAPGTWSPVATFTYRWFAADETLGTGSTLPVTSSMVGAQISVTVTGAATGYDSLERTSAATAPVTLPLVPSAPVPTISGTVKFGNTLTAVPGTAPSGATVQGYQWSRSSSATGTYVSIDGATSSTYPLTVDDITRFLRVTVTWQKSGNANTPKTSASSVAVAVGTFATAPTPTISGNKVVGQTLTANLGTWSPVADTYSYQWSSATTATGTYTPITDATAATYVLQDADRGKFVKVTVTGVKSGFTSVTTLSAATAGVVAAFTTAPTPTISGTVAVGQTLTAIPGTWSPGPPVATLTYQWSSAATADGTYTPIALATAATYVLQVADRGKFVKVAVTGAAPSYETTVRTSAPTVAVDYGTFITSPNPTITGSAVSGQTLTAAPGTWSPVATFTYRWFAADETLGTGSTLPVTSSMVGAQISVTVTGAATGYDSLERTSAATAPVTLPLVPSAPVPTISGTVKFGNTLTAVPGTAPSGATVQGYQWSRSSSATGTYVSIDGATSSTYPLTVDDITRFLRVTVTWQKSGNANTPKTSASSVAVAVGTFATAPTPTISGNKVVGQTLTANLGTWSPVADTYSYQWSSATTATGTYTPITDATAATYVLQDADRGKFVKVTVTGVKSGFTSVTTLSAATAGVVAAFTTAPTPTISGTVAVGQTLTAIPGTWSPGPPVATLTYQWSSAATADGTYTPIALATAATYVLQVADRGKFVKVAVTGAAPSYEMTVRTSAPTVAVDYGTFITSPNPTITGSAVSGQTLTAAPGTWSPVATFTYRWFAADETLGTGSTLPVTSSMVGAQISVTVTGAATGYDSLERTSAATAPVTLPLVPSAPVPTISGTVKFGNTLTAVPGTAPSGATVQGYQWSRSSSATGTYVSIDGATSSTYPLTVDDITRFLRVTVTWQKSGNANTPKTSASSVAVAVGTFATAPTPTISGNKVVGQTLTANLGTWSPVADTYSYQWSSATTATGTYTPITDATAATYVLQDADRGKFVKVTVTGVKSGFTSVTTLSAATAGVVAAFTTAPTPTISGTVAVGQTLTAIPGTWSPVATLTYQWSSAATADGTYTPIALATTATYALKVADRGKFVKVAVTGAAPSYEMTVRTSAPTVAVDYGTFTTSPNPTITGSAVSGQTLTAAPGTWSPVATFTYRWFADSDLISGATTATLPVTSSMNGKQITVEVTGAATGYTSTPRTSAATATVTLPLIPSAPVPTISGTVKFGNTLTAVPGTAPSGATVQGYQWSRSSSATGSYVSIDGATSSTYPLTVDDITRFLRVTVTWQKSGNTNTPKTSASSVAVAAGTFVTTPLPTISGTARVGQTLTANLGTWSPVADTYSYQWSRATTATGTYTPIGEATSSTYALISADLGKFIKVTVTGTKSGYTGISRISAATAAILSP